MDNVKPVLFMRQLLQVSLNVKNQIVDNERNWWWMENVKNVESMK